MVIGTFWKISLDTYIFFCFRIVLMRDLFNILGHIYRKFLNYPRNLLILHQHFLVMALALAAGPCFNNWSHPIENFLFLSFELFSQDLLVPDDEQAICSCFHLVPFESSFFWIRHITLWFFLKLLHINFEWLKSNIIRFSFYHLSSELDFKIK